MRSPNKAAAAVPGGKTTPCCIKVGLKRGPWTPEEDELLSSYIKQEGEGRWRTLPKRAGLLRCGKSCRLRWMNYLRPSVKRGQIAPDEEDLILRLHRLLGNRWSLIAGRIPGRTDNEIKNYWNTHLSKKLISQGIDPRTHKPLNQEDNRTDNNNSDSPDVNSSAKEASSSKQPVNQNHTSVSPTSDPISASSGTEEINKQPLLDSDPTANEFDDQNGFTISNLLPKYTDEMGNATTRISSSHVLGHEVDEDINNYCTDEVFSSFVNSLINEEAFTGSHHNQQPLLNGASSSSNPLMISNPISALGLGWESFTQQCMVCF